MKFYFIINLCFHYVLQNISTQSASRVDHSDIIVTFSSIHTFNVIYHLYTLYPACLLTAHMCSLISWYIVNHQECFRNNNVDLAIFRVDRCLEEIKPLYWSKDNPCFLKILYIFYHYSCFLPIRMPLSCFFESSSLLGTLIYIYCNNLDIHCIMLIIVTYCIMSSFILGLSTMVKTIKPQYKPVVCQQKIEWC